MLSSWAGEGGLTDAAVGKAAASAAGKVGGKAMTKILAKTMCEKAGILLGKKLGGKLAAKIAAKFGASWARKRPLVSSRSCAAVGGGINLWFITSIADSAEAWYRTKIKAADA